MRRLILAQKRERTIIKEDEPGLPTVTVDSTGNILSYESSEEFEITGDSNVDTGFIPFDGKDFEIHLKATFSYYDNMYVEYPTILNAMEETPPYNGFIIRYEGSQLYFVHQSAHWTMSVDRNNIIDVYITCSEQSVTVKNNNTSICSFDIDYNIEGLTVVVGSSVDIDGNPQRYANCTVHEFNVTKK